MSEYMQIVAALTDPADASRAQELGADIIELRFDLMEGDPLASVPDMQGCMFITHNRYNPFGAGRWTVFRGCGCMV